MKRLAEMGLDLWYRVTWPFECWNWKRLWWAHKFERDHEITCPGMQAWDIPEACYCSRPRRCIWCFKVKP